MRQQQRNICKLGNGSHLGKIIALTLLSLLSQTSLHAIENTRGDSTVAACADTLAQPVKKKESGIVRFLNRLTEVDTNYVRPNMYNLQGMVYSDMLFNIYKLSGEDENGENTQSLYFSPYSTLHVGPYISYSLIFMGYTFNLGRKQTSSGRSNMYLCIYSPIIGIDYYYQK